MSRRGPLAFMASNSVAANILMVLLLGGGALLLTRLTVEVFPELEGQMITVQVPYLGAAPAEVEEGVCMRVEEAIAGVEGVDRITSIAVEGVGTVIAELDEDADHRRVLDDIKAEVDRIETFPEETERPIVSVVTNRSQVITLVLHGDISERTLKYLAERVRDDLTANELISQVELAGVREFEIAIEVSEDTLRRHGLSFGQVAAAVAAASLDLPGGTIHTDGGQILVRGKGQRYTGPEFEDIVVLTTPDGGRIRLGELADVRDTFAESDIRSRFDGEAAAHVRVFRIGNQGALEIADAVTAYVENLRTRLPEGVEVATWEDRSEILASRISLLLRNGRIGLLLVFICLSLFLDLRLAFWTTMGIPISFLGAFLFIPQLGITINMISLFAFITALGLVVDDAIVVGENVFAYQERGIPPLEAAIRGAREMALPVTFAILTSVAAYLPLAFTSGLMGEVMRQIPIVVCAVLLVSLVEALLILPAHLAHRGTRAEGDGPIAQGQRWFRGRVAAFIDGPYSRTLDVAIRNRYATVAIGVACLALTAGYVAGGHIKFTFMPRIDADNLIADLTMPEGTPLDRTAEIVERMEAAARRAVAEAEDGRDADAPPLLRHISTTIGQQPRGSGQGGPHAGSASGASGGHLAEINVELSSGEEREIPASRILNRWRELVGEVPGASSLTFTSELFTAGEDISVELAHRDFDTLIEAAERAKERVAEFAGVSEVADSFEPGKLELRLRIRPEARNLGLTLADLARQSRQAFYGEEVQRIQRGRDDVRVKVRYPRSTRETLATLDRMRIRLPDGTGVPFDTVADVTLERGYAAIDRIDRRRVVTVTAAVDDEVANANEINAQLRTSILPELQRDIPGLSFDFGGEQREQQKSMNSLVVNFVVAQLLIFCLLAIPLRSYAQPLLIMSAIPFGLVGAVIGHILMGYNLSMLSFMGVVALTGIVVNDSLIMVDLINRRRAENVALLDVIRESGTRRFRPVILTTLTTFFGLMPMILEKSLQARFLIPMAISLGFGILFATAITLLLVPCGYGILEDVKRFVRRHTVGDGEPWISESEPAEEL